MNDADTLALLAACPWLAGAPADALAMAASESSWRRLAPGECLYRVGDRVEHVFGVRAGSFKLVAASREGRESVTTVVPEGGWFGDFFCFSGEPSFIDCVALEPAQALALRGAALHAIGARWPEVYRRLLGDVARKGVHVFWMSVQHKLASPELKLAQRLVLVLEHAAGASEAGWTALRGRYSHELLAQMLGLSRPRVTIAVQALVDAGLLRAVRGRLAVQAERLRAYCRAEQLQR